LWLLLRVSGISFSLSFFLDKKGPKNQEPRTLYVAS
jgi:hypothetical protein